MGKKRSSKDGNIRKMKSGNWRGELMDGYTEDGKRNIVRFSAPTKGEVAEKIRNYWQMRETVQHISKQMTLSAWADVWYADYKGQVRESTYASYRYTLKHIKDQLGEKKLSDILPIDINRFQDNLVCDGYSLSQISKCRALMIQMFDAAENNDLVHRNPARKAKIVTRKDSRLAPAKQSKDSFRQEEIDTLFSELPKNLLGDSVRVVLISGLRIQELLALEVEDLAEDGSWIRVSKAIMTVNGHPQMGPPKSEAGNRVIPIAEKYRDHVIRLRRYQTNGLIWRSTKKEDPYFSVKAFRDRYYTALKKLPTVRKLSPHCCRHTYVTMLQSHGVAMETIAKLAGHTDISTTNNYLHISDDTLKNAVELLDI